MTPEEKKIFDELVKIAEDVELSYEVGYVVPMQLVLRCRGLLAKIKKADT